MDGVLCRSSLEHRVFHIPRHYCVKSKSLVINHTFFPLAYARTVPAINEEWSKTFYE